MLTPEHNNPKNQERSKGIYLLPNLFTTSALFAGFYAIVAAMHHDYTNAAIAIFIAMIMDTLDGRVARLTNTESAFGAEYDSLSDIVCFGIAPSLVVYSFFLVNYGKIGWLVAFFYTAATALRLARFNSRLHNDEDKDKDKDKDYFQGLPCTSAAGVIAGMVWAIDSYANPHQEIWVFILMLTLIIVPFLLGVLMVSNIRYYSFKAIDLRGHVPFVAVLAVLFLFVCISIDPPFVLLAVFAGYALSGPLFALRRRIITWRKARAHDQ